MVITVRVHPHAARTKAEWNGSQLELWVTAAPVHGAANVAVLKAVAAHLDVPVTAVTLRSGAHGRTKLVEVTSIQTTGVPPRQPTGSMNQTKIIDRRGPRLRRGQRTL